MGRLSLPIYCSDLTFWQEIRQFVSLAGALSRPRRPRRPAVACAWAAAARKGGAFFALLFGYVRRRKAQRGFCVECARLALQAAQAGFSIIVAIVWVGCGEPGA